MSEYAPLAATDELSAERPPLAPTAVERGDARGASVVAAAGSDGASSGAESDQARVLGERTTAMAGEAVEPAPAPEGEGQGGGAGESTAEGCATTTPTRRVECWTDAALLDGCGIAGPGSQRHERGDVADGEN